MRSFLKINKEENENRCENCVFYKGEDGFCSIKKKAVEADKKCRKFQIDITVKSAKKRHAPNVKKYSPEDFDI